MFDKIKEECGVFGIFSTAPADLAPYAYNALFALQHRGQESCGIAQNNDGIISVRKDSGLVNEVFDADSLRNFGAGNIVLGHVRYGTANSGSELNTQPLVVNHIKGSMALAHNGSLINNSELREKLELEGAVFHTTSDCEVISYVIIKERLKTSSVEEAVIAAMDKIKGAYSLLIMSPTKLIAVRDPFGFRPLCMGKLGGSVVFASESTAFNAIGAEFTRDVRPGEVIVADRDGIRSYTEKCGTEKRALCVFEYIYFARPDSVIDGFTVHEARVRAGEFLAIESPAEADVVIGVPDSGIDAALGYARQSGIPYGLGLIKSKYIGRTFIQPTQVQRENLVKMKLSPVISVIKDKRVILIEDSIVRGTTSRRIIKLLREAGAREVHMRVSSPPFICPCYFGTDIESKDDLIASKNNVEQVGRLIDVDSLAFLSKESVLKLAGDGDTFCSGCFTGKYPLEPILTHKKSKYEIKLSEKEKSAL